MLSCQHVFTSWQNVQENNDEEKDNEKIKEYKHCCLLRLTSRTLACMVRINPRRVATRINIRNRSVLEMKICIPF